MTSFLNGVIYLYKDTSYLMLPVFANQPFKLFKEPKFLPHFPVEISLSFIKESNSSIVVRNREPDQRSQYSICAYCTGRLGNQLFILAASYGIAATKNMSLIIHHSCSVANMLRIGTRYKRKSLPCKFSRVKQESHACAFSENIMNLQPNTSYRLATYLQSWKYFENSFDSLRQELIFNRKILQQRDKILSKLLQQLGFSSRNNMTLIGVHIRRGDMVNNGYGYQVATPKYLVKAVDFFLDKNFTNPIFVVCTNGMGWSQQNMPSNITIKYISNNKPEVDMSVLAACDHIISTVGSFSWWAGFLSGGLVTYFQWPARENSSLQKQFSRNYSDYFIPDWKGISN